VYDPVVLATDLFRDLHHGLVDVLTNLIRGARAER